MSFNCYFSQHVLFHKKGHGVTKKHNKNEVRELFSTSPLVSIAVLYKAAYICKGPTVIFSAHLLTGALNTASNIKRHTGRNAVSFDLQVLTYGTKKCGRINQCKQLFLCCWTIPQLSSCCYFLESFHGWQWNPSNGLLQNDKALSLSSFISLISEPSVLVFFLFLIC